jgi:thermosome
VSLGSVPAVSSNDQPVQILADDASQSKGDRARMNNIQAATMIASIVRSSLGPHGMDKLLVSYEGVITITNDGATMLKEMQIQHPAAKILIELSKATDTTVGDGTTSAVVLAGALLEGADELLRKGVHPVVIVSGFSKAAKKAAEVMEEASFPVPSRGREALVRVARTSMQTKVVANASDVLAGIVADAVLHVATERDGSYLVDMKSIKVEKKVGGAITDTKFIRGVTLDQRLVHPNMPRRVEKAKIAMINAPFTIEATTFNTMITIRDASKLAKFIDEETRMFREMVEKVRATGANVVICQKEMDEIAKTMLERAGIAAVQKAYEYEMPRTAKAVGARIVDSIDDLRAEDLGYADVVEEKTLDNDRLLFFEGCRDPKAVTILIRGGSKRVIEEAERSVHDALMVAKDVLQEPALVAGGGAAEAEAAYQVQKWSEGLSGRDQLAAEKFAEALEALPVALAENAGMDRINAAAELRARHAAGGKWFGISSDGKVKDMRKEDVVEPLSVKRQVVLAATEAASMIIRVDNIVIRKPTDFHPKKGMDRTDEMNAPPPV